MNWLFQLNAAYPVAHAIGSFALVCMAGMAIGSVKVRGVSLGTVGALFASIITDHFAKPVDKGTVYPLIMLLRILCAQVLALTLIR